MVLILDQFITLSLRYQRLKEVCVARETFLERGIQHYYKIYEGQDRTSIVLPTRTHKNFVRWRHAASQLPPTRIHWEHDIESVFATLPAQPTCATSRDMAAAFESSAHAALRPGATITGKDISARILKSCDLQLSSYLASRRRRS